MDKYKKDEYNSWDIPNTIPEFIEWLKEKLSKIPEKHYVGLDESYDEEVLVISYHRPETEEEERDRLKYEEKVKIRELEQLAALKKKYEGEM